MAKAKSKKTSKKATRLFSSLLIALAASLALALSQRIQEVHLPELAKPAELYANQTSNDLTQTYAQAIASAKKSILFVIYSLSDKEIIYQLKKKAEEGIPVQIICDAKASPYIDKKLGPPVSILRRFSKGLMHQKILVVDESLILLGSANMTGESLRMHGNLVTGLVCPEMAACIAERAYGMDNETRTRGIKGCTARSGDQHLELWFLPENKEALSRLKGLIQSAQKSLKIAMFTWTRQDLAHEVIAAAKRGVKVDVVVDRNSGNGASSKIVELLAANGIPTSLSEGKGLLHHKFAYIDGNILVNGSANWTKSAFVENDDCFLVMDPLTPEQQDVLNGLWKVIIHESSPVH